MTELAFLVALAGPDSGVTIAPLQPAWLSGVEATAAVLVTICLCALLAALAILARRLSQAFDRLGDALEKFRQDIAPVTERTASIAEHLEAAAASIHENVDDVGETVREANASLRDALATAEARFKEFDAIVRLARDEAEEAVVSAASVVHGVRTGVSALGRRPTASRDEPTAGESERDRPPPRRGGGPRITRHRVDE